MRLRRLLTAALVAACVALTAPVLSGCAPATGPQLVLRVAHTAAGDIIVDATGHAVYTYDLDTPGTTGSACGPSCLGEWPPLTTASQQPRGRGVAAKIGEITAPDGSNQLTVAGRPLYRFSGDTAPGMINGQGVGGQWWLVAPDGRRITSLRRGAAP